MQLRELNIGCVGGGTGLPSLLGGLKTNPWLTLNAVVTMFDSGGSSGQLRDELGVLPPGDVLKCALALARNEGEARRVLLSRLPTLEHHERLAGHTGGNLLLSMMEQYSGDFLAAVDGLRALLGCRGRVWPVSVEPASICAEYGDGTQTRGEVEVDAGQSRGHQVKRVWLEPDVPHSSRGGGGDSRLRRRHHRARAASSRASCRRCSCAASKEALAEMRGPIILIANLLTEGRGMAGFTAADARAGCRTRSAARRRRDRQHRPAVDRSADALRGRAQAAARARRRSSRAPKRCSAGSGAPRSRATIGGGCRFAVWTVLSQRLLSSAGAGSRRIPRVPVL